MDYNVRQLSKLQAEEYTKMKQGCCTKQQEKAAELCLIYYTDFKNGDHLHSHHISSEKIQLAFKCAYFLAEKSQYTVNLKGEHIRGISFSLNKLLKDFKLDDTMCMLKEFQRYVKIEDKDTSQYLANVIKQISFLYTLHAKFDKTIEKLDLKERIVSENMGTNGYLSIFKSYAWLLFIQSKNKLLKKSLELLPNTYMIAHIISWMLIYSWEYIKPQAIVKVLRERKINENSPMGKQVTRTIKQKLLEHFCIKDLSEYSKVAKIFQEHFNKMIDSGNVRMKNDNDFLSSENLMANYRRLDNVYQKNVDPQDLDERIFMKERAHNYTPTKFTPFARQGYLNKYQKPANKLSGNINGFNVKENFTSHRILNYELIEKEVDNKNIPTHQIKLPKTIMQSPSMVKVPLICSTPVTAGMEMYNYLKEKTKKIKDINMNSAKGFDRKVMGYIDKIFMLEEKQYDEKAKQVKKQTIVALYKISSEQYLASINNQKSYHQNDLMKAFLALSIQLVFFVSNQKIEFEDIEQELKVLPFQMWKAVDYFLKSDKTIPTTLKLHLIDLDVNLVSYKIWRSSQMVTALTCVVNKNTKNIPEFQILELDKLFKRTLHQIAFQIIRLSANLNLDQITSQKIFELMKQILISHADLLFMRHIDQLVMCSIYVIARLEKIKLKFNQIQNVYKQFNPNLRNIIEQIILKVYIDDQNTDADIIKFYNHPNGYLTNPMREYIGALINGQNPTQKSTKNPVLMSPLKVVIPKQINFKSQNRNGVKSKGNITPQTQLLYAYNESPILKYEVSSFRGPLKTKKVLNYDEEEQKVKNQMEEQNNTRIVHPTHYAKPASIPGSLTPQSVTNPTSNAVMTNQFISKKFGRNKVGIQPQQQKQNINNTAINPTNSHRSLFDLNITDKKEIMLMGNGVKNGMQDQTRHKAKNIQMGTYK